MRLTLPQAIERYGPIERGDWKLSAAWSTLLEIPPEICVDWINTLSGRPVRRIYCNKDLAPVLMEALENVRARGLLSQLKTFDGCSMIRDIRGEPGQISTHAYGLAIDINARWNPLGATGIMTPEFVACFKDAGFLWGGDFKRKDGMHFQYAEW